MAKIQNILYGAIQVDKLYAGTDLIFEADPPDTTAPSTTIYPDPTVTHPAGTEFWFEVDEASDTYYTLDGTEPTTGSTLYTAPFALNESATVKYFSVDTSGNREANKTTTVTIQEATTGYRYVRFIGHGDQTGTTTRLVELKALEGATNRMVGLIPISGEAPNGGSVEWATDDIITHDSGTFPYWWLGEGIPTLVYDLGASYPIDSLLVCMYSPSADPRTTQFIVDVSEDNATWLNVADYTANATMQGEEGFTFTI